MITSKEAIDYLKIMIIAEEDDSVGKIKKEVYQMAIEALTKEEAND